jgi:hypothetical protein
MIVFLIYLVFGFASHQVIKSKGYNEWAWWTWLLAVTGLVGLIIALCLPKQRAAVPARPQIEGEVPTRPSYLSETPEPTPLPPAGTAEPVWRDWGAS